jgi:hypothetical protein
MYRTAFAIFACLGLAATCGGAWDRDGNGRCAQSAGSSATEAISTRAVGGISGPKFAPNKMRGNAGWLPPEDVSDRHFSIYLQLWENS